MANIASSKKDARRSAVRATRNRAVKSAVKTKVNRFRKALGERGEAGEQAEQLLVNAVSALDRAAAKGVLHPNNAARRKSRLMSRLNAVEVSAPEPAPPEPARARRSGGRKSASR